MRQLRRHGQPGAVPTERDIAKGEDGRAKRVAVERREGLVGHAEAFDRTPGYGAGGRHDFEIARYATIHRENHAND